MIFFSASKILKVRFYFLQIGCKAFWKFFPLVRVFPVNNTWFTTNKVYFPVCIWLMGFPICCPSSSGVCMGLVQRDYGPLWAAGICIGEFISTHNPLQRLSYVCVECLRPFLFMSYRVYPIRSNDSPSRSSLSPRFFRCHRPVAYTILCYKLDLHQWCIYHVPPDREACACSTYSRNNQTPDEPLPLWALTRLVQWYSKDWANQDSLYF